MEKNIVRAIFKPDNKEVNVYPVDDDFNPAEDSDVYRDADNETASYYVGDLWFLD